jgi:hypothetical protein
MGLEQTVTFPDTVPTWHDVQELLANRGFPIQVRIIDGQLAFPDEIPEEPWHELRVSSDAGMVTFRREQNRVVLITWGQYRCTTAAIAERSGMGFCGDWKRSHELTRAS